MIVKRGKGWQLRSQDGTRLLGRHKSKADALMQERTIQAVKHMVKRSPRPTPEK